MDQRLRLTRLIDSISRDPAAHRDSDAVLQQILGEGDAFFVQVGANDGEQNDPLIDVIRSNPRLRGLLVEPIPYYYDKLVQLHRERLSRINILRAGISNEARSIPFYYVDPAVADEMDGDGPPNRWAHGQGSTQRDVIVYWIRQNAFRGAHYRDNIPRYIDAIVTAELDFVPLHTVTASERFPVIDALVIDVQGHELEVLQSVNFSTRRPRFVYYEDDIEANTAIDALLSRQGYRYLCGKENKLYYDLSAFGGHHVRFDATVDPLPHAGLRLVHKVVSTCIARDLEVWKVTAPQVLSRIAAVHYEVVVPDAEVAQFEAATPAPYRVVPESRYGEGRSLEWVRAQLPAAQAHRAGWYWQQLLKLQAVRAAERADDVVLIWDADTVPVANLHFVAADGRLVLRAAREHHAPYFAALQRLLGLPRQVDLSFIAQCMPARARWARGMASAIEARHGVHWFEAILRCAETGDASGFSEYETLGSWVFHHHNDEIVFSASTWARQGKKVFGSLENFARVIGLDYVAFENWE